jgi:hypothetical protein
VSFGLVRFAAILEFEGPGCDTIEPAFGTLSWPDADGLCKPRPTPQFWTRENATLVAVLVHVNGRDVRVECTPQVLQTADEVTVELTVPQSAFVDMV